MVGEYIENIFLDILKSENPPPFEVQYVFNTEKSRFFIREL